MPCRCLVSLRTEAAALPCACPHAHGNSSGCMCTMLGDRVAKQLFFGWITVAQDDLRKVT